MDQTLRVYLIVIIGIMPRTLRLGKQNQKVSKLENLKQHTENYSPHHCLVLGLKTKTLSNLGLEK